MVWKTSQGGLVENWGQISCIEMIFGLKPVLDSLFYSSCYSSIDRTHNIKLSLLLPFPPPFCINIELRTFLGFKERDRCEVLDIGCLH